MSTFLRGGFLALAIKLQEAADSGDSLSAGDIRTRLSDAINDAHRGTGKWASYIDHFGDAESGDVIFSCDGDMCRCPYEISDTAGAAKCVLNMDACEDVMPRTVYEPEVDEADHMAAMAEAQREKHYGATTPLYERFVGKSERAAASSGSFAGKGKSFPILKAADVSAAASSLGRAGTGNYSADVIKKNIIRIAKEKGFEAELPKSWQTADVKEADTKTKTSTDVHSPTSTETSTKAYTAGNITVTGGAGAGDTSVTITLSGTGLTSDSDGGTSAMESQRETYVIEAGRRNSAKDLDILQAIHDHAVHMGATCEVPAKESAQITAVKPLRLVESAATLEAIRLVEAKADYEIKLIAPGAGSSAFYPQEVLQRDGPKVFKAGTHVYLNHQTAAEEAARPEGDVLNLAGVLTTDASYQEGHAKGPGLYARMKVFADHAKTVEEKAAHVGMSIRASGIAESGKSKGGLPVLKELTAAQSVDVVTHAGAGGMILTEAAKAATQTQEASSMEPDELKLLRESVARLSGKETRREAIQEGARILRDVSLPDAAKEYVIETVLKEALPMKDGALDTVKFTEAVNAEARRFGSAIGAGPRVTGMGAGAQVVEITEAQRAAQVTATKAEEDVYRESWATLLDERPGEDGKLRLAEFALRGRTA